MEGQTPCLVCSFCLVVYKDGSVECSVLGKRKDVVRCNLFRSSEAVLKLLEALGLGRKEEGGKGEGGGAEEKGI